MGCLLAKRKDMNVHYCEPVTVRTSASNTPVSFRWRSVEYRIDYIDRIWRQAHGRPRDQRRYRVRSCQNTFVLHHDRAVGRWSMLRSPLRVRIGFGITSFLHWFIADYGRGSGR